MPVDEIIDQLRREETKLQEQLANIQKQERKSTEELQQVQSALTALGERPLAKSTSRKGKPAATKSDVVDLIQDALSGGTAIGRDALKAAVEIQLREQGRSLAGFALRFKEALTDPRFLETPDGYRISAEQPVG